MKKIFLLIIICSGIRAQEYTWELVKPELESAISALRTSHNTIYSKSHPLTREQIDIDKAWLKTTTGMLNISITKCNKIMLPADSTGKLQQEEINTAWNDVRKWYYGCIDAINFHIKRYNDEQKRKFLKAVDIFIDAATGNEWALLEFVPMIMEEFK